MPRFVKLNAPDGGHYLVCSSYEDTIEKVSPIMWFYAYSCFQLREMAGLTEEEAKRMSIDRLRSYGAKKVPDNLRLIFTKKKKKQQELLLQGTSITVDDLICWFLYSEHLGGTFSQYSYDAGSGEYRGRAPLMIDASNPDHIVSIGKTDLSDEALKHIVEKQQKVLAQIIDFPDGRWFCIYRTHRGLAGRERGEHGSHVHFISSAYGISRDDLVLGFKEGQCPSCGYHVHVDSYLQMKGAPDWKPLEQKS